MFAHAALSVFPFALFTQAPMIRHADGKMLSGSAAVSVPCLGASLFSTTTHVDARGDVFRSEIISEGRSTPKEVGVRVSRLIQAAGRFPYLTIQCYDKSVVVLVRYNSGSASLADRRVTFHIHDGAISSIASE